MASGRPDFHPSMLLEGKHDSDLIPVLVDALGQLYTVMSGVHAGINTPVLVDEDGQIVAVIKGEYLGDPLTVALDSNGLIQVNLSVQDLDYLKVRPVYGQIEIYRVASRVVAPLTEETLHDITGMGAMVGGFMFCEHGSNVGLMEVRLYTEGILCFQETFNDIYERYPLLGRGGVISCSRFIALIGEYIFTFIEPITFETEMQVAIYNPYGYNVTVGCTNYFALVP